MAEKVVWKFPLPIKEHFELELPVGARGIHVGEQDGKPMLWALVNPDARTQAVRFYCCGTGHQIESRGSLDDIAREHIGTVQLGDYAWHCFTGKVA